ncbi:MAG: hypothetical protein ABI237_00450 [Ginsengibacter sp.]
MRKYFITAIIILVVLAITFAVWSNFQHTEYARTSMGMTVVLEVIITAIFIVSILFLVIKKKKN